MEKQIELFDEDPRLLQIPEDKRWNIYKNPTPYQAECNDLYYQCHKLIKQREESKRYIYRIAEVNYGHEFDTFTAANDEMAKIFFQKTKKTDWADLMLVGEIVTDENGEYEKKYPRETYVPEENAKIFSGPPITKEETDRWNAEESKKYGN